MLSKIITDEGVFDECFTPETLVCREGQAIEIARCLASIKSGKSVKSLYVLHIMTFLTVFSNLLAIYEKISFLSLSEFVQCPHLENKIFASSSTSPINFPHVIHLICLL